VSQNEHTPMAIVRRFMSLMEPTDYDAALKLVADDCQYINPPPIGLVVGPQGIRAVLEPFFAPFAENEFQVLRAAADGAVVVLERLDRHRLGDRWIELPVTGVFEVQNGRITYWRDYFDYPTIASQLGQ
jgi:limonene-1,2-epoxide hydrolase